MIDITDFGSFFLSSFIFLNEGGVEGKDRSFSPGNPEKVFLRDRVALVLLDRIYHPREKNLLKLFISIHNSLCL